MCRFGTEGTFFHDDVRVGDAKMVIIVISGGEVRKLLAEVGCDLLGG